ncbi:MAG: hypothetical protein HMLKMBBP_03837 [Planctomycetes bacterium]|nr:hypothetical protein [Planctomycetota bacterium]
MGARTGRFVAASVAAHAALLAVLASSFRAGAPQEPACATSFEFALRDLPSDTDEEPLPFDRAVVVARAAPESGDAPELSEPDAPAAPASFGVARSEVIPSAWRSRSSLAFLAAKGCDGIARPTPQRPAVTGEPPVPAAAMQAAVLAPSRAPAFAERPAPPAYPSVARRRGWEGRTVVRVTVGADGGVRAVRIVESSGRAVLDEAALAAARDWRFVPGEESGAAAEAALDVPVVFRLDD